MLLVSAFFADVNTNNLLIILGLKIEHVTAMYHTSGGLLPLPEYINYNEHNRYSGDQNKKCSVNHGFRVFFVLWY